MKPRRIITGILAALFLATLLCGCKPSGDNKETTSTSPVLPTTPKENPKDVAFTCYNFDFDYYPYCSLGGALEFYILTRKPVDVTDIIVTIPVEQGYNVYVYDDSAMNDHYQLVEVTKDSDGTFHAPRVIGPEYQPYLYQTSRGMDWEDLGRKKLRQRQASDQYEKLRDDGLLNTPEGEAALEELSEASAEYLALSGAFLAEYSQLTPADLPTFYYYRVQVFFEYEPERENASFQEIQVDIAGESYTVPIGEIRLHNEMIGETEDGVPALNIVSSGAFWCNTYPYCPGIQNRDGFTLEAKKDVTLLGCELADSDTGTMELLEIQLTVSDENGSMDLIWDGKTAIQIPKGKQVKFDFVIRDERLEELFYGGMLTPVVTYEHEGQTYIYAESMSMHRYSLEPWLWYSVCLQGMDFESYFSDYYYYAVDTAWKEYRS